VHFFGVWTDPDTALQKYCEERDDLQAGRIPRRFSAGKATTGDVVTLFLARSEQRMQAGELSAVSFLDYKFVGTLAIEHLSPTFAVFAIG